MTARRYAAAGVLVAAAALLLASTRPWLSGRTADPVLGAATVLATGAQVAPAAVALAAVCLAALVVALTAGPRARVVATVALVVSAAGAGFAVARVAVDPSGALSVRAAEQAGRTGTVAVTATTTGWVWFALGCAVLLLAGCLWLAVELRGTGGLSGRFDRPSTAPAPGPARSANTWDALSEGRDPTDGSPDGH
ncbi:MAG: Trp biosynthesis-associated membrane protein [Dermatophilaceae bacterium]